MTNILDASAEWAVRPADERFWTLDEMAEAVETRRLNCGESNAIRLDSLHFIVGDNEELLVQGRDGGSTAKMSNWAMTQFLSRINYPRAALVDGDQPRIPAELAAEILNYRLDQTGPEDRIVLLLQSNGDDAIPTVRCATSDSYARFWDADIMPFARDLQTRGYRVPPARPVSMDMPGCRAATEEDCLELNESSGFSLNVRPGDLIGPAGLYSGDQTSFIFLVDPRRSTDEGNHHGLMRGMFIKNSEVGASSFQITQFVMQEVCGNHIVWGAKDVINIKYRHVGDARDRIFRLLNEGIQVEDSTNFDDELRVIEWMKQHKIANNRDDVIDFMYGVADKSVITKKALTRAWEFALEYEETDGEPGTLMSMVNGLTRYSQTMSNADKRMLIDSAVAEYFNRAAEQV